MSSHVYVRLKPYAPKLGFEAQRVHIFGTLFVGGYRPIWYKVSPEFAEQLAEQRQESGAEMFEIVNEAQKQKVDQFETAQHMAALGMAAATAAAPMQAAPVDLTGSDPKRPGLPAPAAPTAPTQPAETGATGARPGTPGLRSSAIPSADPAPTAAPAIPSAAPVPVSSGFEMVGGGDLSTSDFAGGDDK